MFPFHLQVIWLPWAPDSIHRAYMIYLYIDRLIRRFDEYINYISIILIFFLFFSFDLTDRKGGLLLNNVLGIVGGCLMGFTKMAHSYEMLFFGRFIIGVNCGLNTSLVPMYISEIAPLNLRGGLGTVNQLAVTVGLLVSQVLGIEQILGTDEGWPVLLLLAICPAILQLLLLPVCPESPR